MILAILSALLLAAPPAPEAIEAPAIPPTRSFAVVVGTTRSDRPGLPTLRYADDDAARWQELFTLLGAKVELLVVMDADTQARHADLAAQSRIPSRSELQGALDRSFAAMSEARARGERTAFYFVFAGHGDLDETGQGYLVLQDGRFTRGDLYERVLAASTADVNHLVLDACRAWFMVAGRGGSASSAVREVLDQESLERYPNTGVLIATTPSAEVHEWARFEAGVFSHELRSAIAGAADADGDGRVGYPEIAGFVAAANAGVSDPRGKLAVVALPPRINLQQAFADWNGSTVPRLRIESATGEPLHLEDDRGVRIADLHPEVHQALSVSVAAGRTVFVRGQGWEARWVTENGTTTLLAALEQGPPATRSRGSVEDAFERGLFQEPFGSGFLRGFLQQQRTTPAFAPPRVPRRNRSWKTPTGWSGVGASAALGASAFWMQEEARRDAARYEEAFGSAGEVRRMRTRMERRNMEARLLGATSLATGLASGWLLWNDRHTGSALAVSIDDRGAAVVFGVRFGGPSRSSEAP